MSQQQKEKKEKNINWIWKSVGCACLVSMGLLLILAVILWKIQPEEKVIVWGINAVYILASFAGGFWAGKLKKRKKLFCGLLIGIIYYIILIAISLSFRHTISNSGADVLPVLMMCLCGGMAGGMVA